MQVGLVLAALAVFFGGLGEGLTLPLFIRTFINGDKHPGEYFVFFMMSLSFIPVFGGLLLTDIIRKRPGKIAIRKEMIFMGILDALNGLLIVFTSALGRTNGDLQAVLLQITIPLTLVFSAWIYKIVPSRSELLCAAAVVLGILVSVVPSIKSLNSHAASDWYYPVLFLIGTVPGVLMNVVPHGIFKRDKKINLNFVLLVESIVQLATCALLFWADLIPGFGTSSNLTEFNSNFRYGFECFFSPSTAGGDCDLSWVFGVTFSLCYCLAYFGTLYIVRESTANFSAMITALCPAMQIVVWYASPALTHWAGGEVPSTTHIVFGLVGMGVLILPGAILYRYFEMKRTESDEDELEALLGSDAVQTVDE